MWIAVCTAAPIFSAEVPPLISIQEFLASAGRLGETNLIRVQGTVTHTISDRTYFIQDGGAGVYVFHKPEIPLHTGELVEVTGYASLGGLVPTLQKCRAKVIGMGTLPAPELVSGSDLLSSTHAMKLVRIEGTLVHADLMGGRLMLLRSKDGRLSFQVNLEAVENSNVLTPPEPGCVLEVVGVLVLKQGPDGHPAHASVLVRTLGDLKVTTGPPFWTPRRVGQTLVGLLIVLAAALAWVWVLRKQVRSQTRLVEEKFEREAALKALEDRFAKVFRAAPDPLIITRASDDVVLEVNPAFEALCGLKQSQILERPEEALGLWTDKLERKHALALLSANGSLANFDCTLQSSQGKKIACLYAAEWIELRGERCRLGILRDVTEQKRLEEERRALQNQLGRAKRIQALGTLAGGIAHDFNNILAAIIGNADLAGLSSRLPEEVAQSIEEIRKASLRGRNLVEQILSFSRTQPHGLKPIQLGPIVAEAAGLLRATMPPSVTFESTIDPQTPPVLADATQIHQIVMNLGTNAGHAIGEKAGWVKIELTPVLVDAAMCARSPDLQPGSYACLRVSDSGVGMTSVVQERIFEPFFTTKGPGKGTGLGLAAVHAFVKGHGGAIDVQSEPGRGSTFSIYFPATDQPIAPPVPGSSPPSIPPVKGNGLELHQILLIDDEDLVLSVVSRILKRLGYGVTALRSPSEAIALFESDPGRFNLVLTDLNMPDLSGIEVTKRVRAMRPDLPVILASGNVSMELSGRAISAGASRIIQKPITLAELSQAVESELKGTLSRVR